MYIHYRLADIPANLYSVLYMGKKNLFLSFDSKEEFLSFYLLHSTKRHFYEIVTTHKRRLFFDIDIYMTKEQILSLIDDIIQIIYNRTNILVSVTLFKSCEKSYHIVVRDVEFSIEECKYICHLVDPEKKIFDHSVYKSVQFVRFEGSTKYGQNRIKKRVCLSTDFQVIDMIPKEFFKNTINSSSPPSINKSNAFIDKSIAFINNKRIDENKKEDCIFKDRLIVPSGFKIRKIINRTFILLSRTHSDFCTVCKRVHDSENGYMKFARGTWVFFCFRHDSIDR